MLHIPIRGLWLEVLLDHGTVANTVHGGKENHELPCSTYLPEHLGRKKDYLTVTAANAARQGGGMLDFHAPYTHPRTWFRRIT